MPDPGPSSFFSSNDDQREGDVDGGQRVWQNQGLTEPLLGKQQIPSYVQDPETHPAELNDAQIASDNLKRGLSARQVQMIALAGTIGTGLFLGTGKSLAEGKQSSPNSWPH
jgi:amino acid permease